jgi:hypothetical protein
MTQPPHSSVVNLGEQLRSRDACPPEFVVERAVLTADELLLAHIGRCEHCSGIYERALDHCAYTQAPKPEEPGTRHTQSSQPQSPFEQAAVKAAEALHRLGHILFEAAWPDSRPAQAGQAAHGSRK